MKIKPIRPKWKGMMTDRERFNRQMHYKSVDRCFNMEFGYWKDNFELWPVFVKNNIKKNWEADILFNFDQIKTTCGAYELNPAFEEVVVAETRTTKTIVNSMGLMAEVPKDGHETIPHFTQSSVNTPDDWKKVKKERFRLDDPIRKVDVAKLKKKHPPTRDYPLGVHCGSMIGRVRDMLTFEGLAYACYDYPQMVEDMVENQCQMVECFLDQVLDELDFDFASSWEDICFNSGPIVSVDFFKHVVVPRYKRIRDRLERRGIDLWYTDCDGDVRPILSLLLDGGINCLFPFEVNSCAHPGELLDQYGRDLRIMGGVNKMDMAKGPKAIKVYLESLAPYVERGGYIPFCDHRCPPDVSQENYFYYLDLKEKMFGMNGVRICEAVGAVAH